MVAIDVCGKSHSRGNGYMRLRESIHVQQLCLFLTFSGVFTIILILLFLLVYISFLTLFSLLTLMLSSFIYLLFSIVIF